MMSATNDGEDPPGPAASGGNDWRTRASIFQRLNTADAGARETAWADFQSRYTPMIAGFARRCGAGRGDVEDIVRDVVAAFYAVSGDFAYDPGRGRFRGWLKTCTVRAAVRRAGKNLRFNGVPLTDVPQLELAVDALWNDVWEKELVAQTLDTVRKDSGSSMTFRAFEQYVLLDRPAERVAAELGISTAAVYQAKTRITRQLREALARAREIAD